LGYIGKAKPSPNSVQKGGKHLGKGGKHAKDGCLDVLVVGGMAVGGLVYALKEIVS